MEDNTFIYSHAELELLGTPGLDRDRIEADDFNARQATRLAVQSETTVTPIEEV
jgi:hypothetical protein